MDYLGGGCACNGSVFNASNVDLTTTIPLEGHTRFIVYLLQPVIIKKPTLSFVKLSRNLAELSDINVLVDEG